jgi:psiF repeat
MMRILRVVISVAALLASGGTTVAQQQQPQPMKSHSAGSIECSKQADDKGLHGKARKHFRSKCKKELRKQAA